MRRTVPLVALLFAISCQSLFAQTGVIQFGRPMAGVHVQTPGNQPWTNTGYFVNTGDTILTYSFGMYSSLVSAGLWWGPAGQASNGGAGFLVPDAAAYSLVGRIGTRDGFYVGERNCFVNIGAADYLWLGINDITNWGDNDGTLVTWIAPIHNGVVGVGEEPFGLPAKSSLSQNYPNPFNPQTTIQYQVASAGDVAVRIYDVNGRLVRAVDQGHQVPGHYSLIWNGKDDAQREVASGSYFYQVRVDGFMDTKKMILLR